MIFDALRPFISRALAAVFATLITWLLSKGIDLGKDAAGQLTEVATTLLIGGFTLVYGVLHKTIDKSVNPGDAASSHLASREKTEAETIKAKASMYDAARGNQ